VTPAHIGHEIARWWVFVRVGESGLLQAALAALAGWIAIGAVNLYLTRKRIAWRAYMDAEVTLHPEQARHIEQARKAGPAGPRVKFKVYIERPHHDPDEAKLGKTEEDEVEDPSLVLLRIRNSGFVPISGTEFDPLLKFSFPGREVRGAQPIDSAGNSRDNLLLLPLDEIPETESPRPSGIAATLRAIVRALLGIAPAGAHARGAGGPSAARGNGDQDFIRLSPTVRLNARERISALLVLSGKPDPDREKIEQPEGKILRGHIDNEQARTGPIPISPKVLAALFVPVALIGVIVGLLAAQPAPTAPVAQSCTGGRLTLIGSTAFAPVAQTIAAAYTKGCPTASIAVAPDSNGSVFGLTTLVGDGAKEAAGVIAMSDGPAPAGPTYRPLSGKPIAIIIFAVAVNKGVGLRDLTATDIQKMYNGTYTNWSQLKGPDIPIRLISREFGSGTRRAFDADVLGGSEPSPTSFDCKTKPASAKIILCTVEQTSNMLADIASIPGTLGFAQTGDVAANTGGGVQPVALDGLSPDYGDIGRSANEYAFWTVEYLYTYGPATGLTEAFLKYLGTPTALSDLQAADYTPCPADSRGRAGTLCGQAGS
jgi:phosphate transport system substrate-binding protein